MSLFFSASFPVTLHSFCGFGFVLKVLILLWGIGKFYGWQSMWGMWGRGSVDCFGDWLVARLSAFARGQTEQLRQPPPGLHSGICSQELLLSSSWHGLPCSWYLPCQQPAFLPVNCWSCPLTHQSPLLAASKKTRFMSSVSGRFPKWHRYLKIPPQIICLMI